MDTDFYIPSRPFPHLTLPFAETIGRSDPIKRSGCQYAMLLPFMAGGSPSHTVDAGPHCGNAAFATHTRTAKCGLLL